MVVTDASFTVALDAMGSDSHPTPEIEGAVACCREYPEVRVLLVGDEQRLRPALEQAKGLPIDVVHTDEAIAMTEHPVHAMRRKKRASMRIALELVKEGKAQGIVSAGNTGALMTLAKVIFGSLDGVDRPALATILPTLKQPTLIIDIGANVDCRPIHIEQFAVMGSVYSQLICNVENPTVGLLSIGEEEIKGNELTREAHQALKTSRLNFIGNVEGKDLYSGEVNVVVCDGFVGNVALKVSEGVIAAFTHVLKQELSRNWRVKLGAFLTIPAFRALKKKFDYTEYGGGQLLGIRYPMIIGHGRSNAVAMKNAIRVARELHINQIPRRIEQEVAAFTRDSKEHVRMP